MYEYLTVNFYYLCNDKRVWQNYPLSTNEYFDLSQLDQNELIVVDSIPLFDDLIDYLPDDLKIKIDKLKLIIKDVNLNRKIIFHQTFWNNQNNWILNREDYNDDLKSYHETIIRNVLPKKLLNNKYNIYEILRYINNENEAQLVYHGYISDNFDGSQNEIVIS